MAAAMEVAQAPTIPLTAEVLLLTAEVLLLMEEDLLLMEEVPQAQINTGEPRKPQQQSYPAEATATATSGRYTKID